MCLASAVERTWEHRQWAEGPDELEAMFKHRL